MSRAEEIRDAILGNEEFRESRVLERSGYGDEPILRTGREMLERKRALDAYDKILSSDSADRRSSERQGWGSLFFEQAKLMEHQAEPPLADYLRYDYDKNARYRQLSVRYVEYRSLNREQLRAYFSWRTLVREGQIEPAPGVFFCLLASELVMGIGVEGPMDAHERLEALRTFVVEQGGVFTDICRDIDIWLDDLVICFGLDRSLLRRRANTERDLVVLRDAERSLLRTPDALWITQAEAPGFPAPQEILDVLVAHSNYRLERSLVYKSEKDALAQIAAAVFSRMVAHCAKHRKKGFVEGMFGAPVGHSTMLFPRLLVRVPNESEHDRYRTPSGRVYTRQHAGWQVQEPTRKGGKSKQIGRLLHAIDCAMREQPEFDFPPLKPWPKTPKFELKIVDEEVGRFFEAQRAKARAHVSFDFGKLSGIRSEAGRIREVLLVDEEREENGADSVAEMPAAARLPEHEGVASACSRDGGQLPAEGHDAEAIPVKAEPVSFVQGEQHLACAVAPSSSAGASGAELGLSAQQLELLEELLSGNFDASAWTARGIMWSLEVDAVNEVLFDAVGDTVITCDENGPRLVEDYIEDVKEVLS